MLLIDVNKETLNRYRDNPYTNTELHLNKVFATNSKDPDKLLRDAIEAGHVHTLVWDGNDEFIFQDFVPKNNSRTDIGHCMGYLILKTKGGDE